MMIDDDHEILGGTLERTAPSPASLALINPVALDPVLVPQDEATANADAPAQNAPATGQIDPTHDNFRTPPRPNNPTDAAATARAAADGPPEAAPMPGGRPAKEAQAATSVSNNPPLPSKWPSTDDSGRPLGSWIYVMMDRGANCKLSTLMHPARYAVPGTLQPTNVRVNGQGKGQATASTTKLSMPIVFENSERIALDEVYDSPDSRKFLIDENDLYNTHGIWVDTPKEQLCFPSGSTVPLYTRGDHRFWACIWVPVQNTSVPPAKDAIEEPFDSLARQGLEANVAEPEVDELECAAAESPERAKPNRRQPRLGACAASLATTCVMLLLAARLGVGSVGLVAMRNVTDGMPDVRPTLEERRLIDADVHRRASVQRRHAADKISKTRAKDPGHTLAFDGYGPFAPSLIGRTTYQMHCVCRASCVGIVGDTCHHREEDWFDFVAGSVRQHRAWGNKVFACRFDRAGELTAPGFRRRVESELNVTVEYAPSKWHEGVTGPEGNNDILTRAGEAMLARAGLGPRYLAAARAHAQHLINLRPLRGKTVSRLEHASKHRVDLRKTMPYIFCCTVIVLRDEGVTVVQQAASTKGAATRHAT